MARKFVHLVIKEVDEDFPLARGGEGGHGSLVVISVSSLLDGGVLLVDVSSVDHSAVIEGI